MQPRDYFRRKNMLILKILAVKWENYEEKGRKNWAIQVPFFWWKCFFIYKINPLHWSCLILRAQTKWKLDLVKVLKPNQGSKFFNKTMNLCGGWCRGGRMLWLGVSSGRYEHNHHLSCTLYTCTVLLYTLYTWTSSSSVLWFTGRHELGQTPCISLTISLSPLS